MQAIELRVSSPQLSHARTICGYLGSYDPLHKGHEWIVTYLLDRFDAVLLLVPVGHFEKTVQFPRNATFDQRIAMLTTLKRRWGERIAAGLAHEVLFLRLAEGLKVHFPAAEMFFSMGNETFAKVLDSPAYYKRTGLAWTAEEHAKLEQLRKRIVVFGRSANGNGVIPVPEQVRWISSTAVRETVQELWNIGAPEEIWQARLETMISPEIIRLIRQTKLYTFLA